ncbi:MAG: exodeoxyribonuclease VII large subunit [Bacilli bacterium]|nr:exodeoxyribonuclease VII large subunit [Bacilli bacterium]
MMETKNYYSVSQVNEYIKTIFDNIEPLRNITIRGEVSNCRGRNKSGHIYFSLKDNNCIINAVIFKFETIKLNFEPKNGDDVIVNGSISSYPPNGTYQIIIKNISLFGKGEILLRKEELKKRLYNEGLFDAEHKKKIPEYPSKIAIITGKNSAASRDFEFNILRRFPLCEIINFYSLVQGLEAPEDLIKNLKKAIESNPDLIIIGRGGGSSDDLEAFDNESLVRELYDCPIPTISAVGHEIDLSLCDLVCDLHVSTPTGAAEAAVPDVNLILDDLKQTELYIKSIMTRKIADLERELNKLSSSKYFLNANLIFDSYLQKINEYKNFITLKITHLIDKNESLIKTLNDKLILVNPENILNKGYSIAFNKEGNVIKSIKDVNKGDEFKLKVKDGYIDSKVEEVHKQ